MCIKIVDVFIHVHFFCSYLKKKKKVFVCSYLLAQLACWQEYNETNIYFGLLVFDVRLCVEKMSDDCC